MYDLELYRDEMRGFYLTLEELPGEIVQKDHEVLEKIQELCPAGSKEAPAAVHTEFNQRFNSLNDGRASERLVEEVF